MDFESGRTEKAAEAHDIEICDLSGDSLRFESEHSRVSRILRLARDHNPANALPDKLCGIGASLFAFFSIVSLLVWGAIFRNATLVLVTWAVLSFLIALPVLLTVYIRQTCGLASKLHKFQSVSLTLTPDRVILEMRRHRLFRGNHPPTVRREFLYSRISRMEYDRPAKTLRLSSAERRDAPMDVVMFYENSERIIGEIEKRSGVFVHPAMQGDDYADLNGLPGLKRERSLLRPLSAGALAFCLLSLLTALSIRTYNHSNPYMPYPETKEIFLTGTFGIEDTITLDGCDITLTGVSRAGSDIRGVCYQFIVTLQNHNSSAIRLHTGESGKPGNIFFTADTEEGGIIPLETSGAPLGYVGIDIPLPRRLGGEKGTSVTFFVWVPDGIKDVTMTANSDYWPPQDVLRDVTYQGITVDVGGRPVKSNEVRFTISKAALESL